MSQNSTEFNTLLAKPRVKSEHCIGILKGRFPFFKSIRMKIAKKKDLKGIIQYVQGGVILHNWLVKEEIDAGWCYDEVAVTAMAEDDLGAEPATELNQANDARRTQILYYLSTLEDTNIN
ncbi:unknown protein [Seminavis robusta]|uniref:DDE Tnp4 domain-containing protein n=1 Tax=Seminavis robusta TaxID=568900 RepID=A0A9N8F2Q3_9STRA|nr:unknown protein [Seminavis robusta]|eukprot:Sro4009_g352500.1 n/a (120) ;mRNA; r:2631-2990